MEQYMMQKFGISQETIRKFLIPGPGDGYGIGPDVLSAYAYPFGDDPTTVRKSRRRLNRFRAAMAGSRGTW